jgi:hypothetical protein
MATIAEKIAERFGNDGERWEDEKGENIAEVCAQICDMNAGVHQWKCTYVPGITVCDSYRFVFDDGSVITMHGGAWDLGYRQCWCWEGAGHGDDCEIRKNLMASIEDLRKGDYSHACSGYKMDLYLDPEDYTVYIFETVGSGWPMRAHNGIVRGLLTIPQDAIPDSLADAVSGMIDRLIDICVRFRGTKWDGNNNVGDWGDEDGDDFEKDDLADLHYQDECLRQIVCHWDAKEWFAYDWAPVDELIIKGETAEEIAASVHLGDSGEVRESDAIEAIQDRMEYLEEQKGS